MAGNLWIDAYIDEPPGCCVNKVYALVFDRSNNALKDPGSGIRVLTPFVSAQQNSFAIILNEHGERSKYYFLNLDELQFSLPATPKGEEYFFEIWRREGVGNFNRSEDILEETRRFIWSGSKLVDSVLSSEDEAVLAHHEAHVSITYDSSTLTVYVMGHLEKNGLLVTNPIDMEVLWLDAAGSTIAHTIQSVYLTNSPGVFRWDQPGVTLIPDRTTAMVVTIRDAAGNPYTTVSYSNAWD
jgi:hypothetical protein